LLVNILASYAYLLKSRSDYLQDTLRIASHANILIDSGGFTDYWKGIKSAATGKSVDKIKVDDYISFCHAVKSHVWGYIQLDKPRDPLASRILLDQQVAAGLAPMPIFIQGMDWDELPRLLSINDHVCISAGWQSAKEYSYQRYQMANKLSNGRIKSHALAWGKYPEIMGLPINSADSSTWINGSRYGVIMIFDKPKGLPIINKTKLKESFHSLRSSKFLSQLRSWGVTAEDMNDSAQWRGGSFHPSLTQASHTYAFLQVMKYIKQASGINYFIVMPGLSKSTHFAQFCAVLHSIDESGQFSYPEYKSQIEGMRPMNPDRFIDYAEEALGRYQYIK